MRPVHSAWLNGRFPLHRVLASNHAVFTVVAPSSGRLQVTTVYVGGISFDTDERALQNYFQKFGNVLETKAR
jgi:hypothetical protein